MTALVPSLPFFVVCPTCNARRYDEGNRRHVTALVGDRYVCFDVVVPAETKAEDMDLVLDALCRRLTSIEVGDVYFVRAA